MTNTDNLPLALVLSGGGVRAMAFHAGVLLQMAENNKLEDVKYISTVSGGSLLVGMIFSINDMRWPSSAEYKSVIFPRIKNIMCSSSLQGAALVQLLNPLNWRYLLSRSNLLAIALEKSYRINTRLSDLPATPEWSINGTTAENGKRFRFKHNSIGDWQLGYSRPGEFPLSKAMAVSAAFPGGLGALFLKTTDFKWEKKLKWDDVSPVEIKPDYEGIHLYDGGVYDNLGLEPFFDAGKGKLKIEQCKIVVSDAGAPLAAGFDYGSLSPFRLKRVLDIISDQSRSLRVRTFLNYITNSPKMGTYLYIAQANLAKTDSGRLAMCFPTSLKRLKESDFDAISGHGQAVSSSPSY